MPAVMSACKVRLHAAARARGVRVVRVVAARCVTFHVINYQIILVALAADLAETLDLAPSVTCFTNNYHRQKSADCWAVVTDSSDEQAQVRWLQSVLNWPVAGIHCSNNM
jgi:hypothetical protein